MNQSTEILVSLILKLAGCNRRTEYENCNLFNLFNLRHRYDNIINEFGVLIIISIWLNIFLPVILSLIKKPTIAPIVLSTQNLYGLIVAFFSISFLYFHYI